VRITGVPMLWPTNTARIDLGLGAHGFDRACEQLH
jgi:hypothetical protein